MPILTYFRFSFYLMASHKGLSFLLTYMQNIITIISCSTMHYPADAFVETAGETSIDPLDEGR